MEGGLRVRAADRACLAQTDQIASPHFSRLACLGSVYSPRTASPARLLLLPPPPLHRWSLVGWRLSGRQTCLVWSVVWPGLQCGFDFVRNCFQHLSRPPRSLTHSSAPLPRNDDRPPALVSRLGASAIVPLCRFGPRPGETSCHPRWRRGYKNSGDRPLTTSSIPSRTYQRAVGEHPTFASRAPAQTRAICTNGKPPVSKQSRLLVGFY